MLTEIGATRKLWYPLVSGETRAERKRRLRRARVNAWAAKNREYHRRRGIEHHALHRERYLQYSRKYHAEHKEHRSLINAQWRAAHTEERKEYMAAWWAKNKHRRKAYDVRRRAIRRAREAEAGFDDAAVNALVASWKLAKTFTCYYCAERFSTKRMHVDHVIPISRGGKHTSGNVCRSCDNCNHRKRDKLPAMARLTNQSFLNL